METQIFHITNWEQDREAISAAAELIRSGGLVIFPTETVYGLGADGLNAAAAARIFKAKERPQDNPLILHVAAPSELDLYCKDIPLSARLLADRFWPGPLTMVLHRRSIVPDVITAGLETVAMRCPSHPIARELIRQSGVPLAAPSANRSGKPSPTRFSHVLDDMNGRVEGMIEGGDCEVGVESTIIDLTEEKPRLLRPGGISLEQLREVLGEVELDTALLRQMNQAETPKAPGMKYRHYAPEAPVTVLCGSPVDTALWISGQVQKKQMGVLCFSEYAACFPNATVVSMGNVNDPEEQGRRLFHALRQFDQTDVTQIYAQCPQETGIGFAVANRLKKAAGFHVETVPEMTAKLSVFGITGGTGAGKTSALGALAKMGACVIDCDAVYHILLAESQALRQTLTEQFGDILDSQGSIDRKKLGRIVFDDKAALLKLNEITHRFVVAEVDRELEQARQNGSSIAAIDAIALVESGLSSRCHRVVGIIAPEALRVQRLMRREGISEEYARLRIRAQKGDEYFRENCDAILENTNDDLTAFTQTATALWVQLLDEIRKEEQV